MQSKVLLLQFVFFSQLFTIKANDYEWQSVPLLGSPPPTRKFYSTVLTQEGTLFLFGGTNGVRQNDIYAFNTSTSMWSAIFPSGSLPSPRYAHVGVLNSDSSLMVVFGGASGTTRFNDLFVYNISSNVWKSPAATGDIPSVRATSSAVVTRDDVMVLFGGSNGRAGTFWNDIYKYDIKSAVWSAISSSGIPPSRRGLHTAVLTKDNIMIVLGGWQGDSNPTGLTDMGFYDVTSDSWIAKGTPSGIFTGVFAHTAVLTSTNKMIVFGGNINEDTYINMIQVYDVATHTWAKPNAQGVYPSQRSSMMGVLTPIGDILLFGGEVTPQQDLATDMYRLITGEYQVPTTIETSAHLDTIIDSSSKDNVADTPQSSGEENITVIVVGAVVGGVVVTVLGAVIIVVITIRRRRSRKMATVDTEMGLQYSKSSNSSKGSKENLRLDTQSSNYAPIKPKASAKNHSDGIVKTWDILWSELELSEELGSGAFGIVHRGVWRKQSVAVKKVCGELTDKQLSDFLAEAELMSRLRPHDNVIQFIGACAAPPAIVSKYYSMGSLESYLVKNPQMSPLQIVDILEDVAAGLGHLHQENVIHRDLASRNILMENTHKLRAVVSDFGFARAVDNSKGGATKAVVGPVRWMAPESLLNQTYSIKSDIYSFGVLAWEMFNGGARPWFSLDDVSVILSVTSGQTLSIPEDCPERLKAIMRSCWKTNPEERMSIETILTELTIVKKELEL